MLDSTIRLGIVAVAIQQHFTGGKNVTIAFQRIIFSVGRVSLPARLVAGKDTRPTLTENLFLKNYRSALKIIYTKIQQSSIQKVAYACTHCPGL